MIGAKLKKLRNINNLTLNELAKILGTTSTTISRYENNQRQPDNETLKSIARYFDVSTDYLLDITNIPNYSLPKSDIIQIPVYNLFDKNLEVPISTLDIAVSSYDFILDFKNLIGFKLRLNSYGNTFMSNDLLIVECTQEINHFSPYYIGKLDSEYSHEHYRIFEFIGSNKKFIFTDVKPESRIIFDLDRIELVGRVIKLIRNF